MAAAEAVDINFPDLPAKHDHFIKYIADHPDKPIVDLIEPYKNHDAELRKAFAQQPDHPVAKESNLVPVFAGHEDHIKVRARDLSGETQKQKDSYIMPLKDEDRKSNGSLAIVPSLRDFKTHFNVFSESSLVDLDWSNVVVAGSAVVTSLLAVPEEHAGSKRALRKYYHETIAPASDVDLFLYGLTEEQAIEKIRQIECNVRDALLVETTTIRTKHTITIASQHPVRHVQIVLRIYKSISEILTGFDVDCSCAAFDGEQVYVSPRALCAYMTQINTIDLTRRSPSYEMRLSKYAHRGFEIYWPALDRSRIDPTIFERSFARTEGLARLLILERLPKNEDRDAYLDKRRAERGRPPVNRQRMRRHKAHGDVKAEFEDEVAEYMDEAVSDYHTITIPYGPKFGARKIEKLIYTKDLLLNSEWNQPKDREVHLHRHPAFFGTVEDVLGDCCGTCPTPKTIEDEEVAEEENKSFISGPVTFMKDDAGRQEIGSFNPLTPEDWTDMAYVGNTALLCQAIVDGDVEYVKSWLAQEGNDPNTRDFTGRAPLHLGVSYSTLEVVQALIDHGARLVARLVDGRTALHLAAMRGSVEMVSALLRKSEANEEEEEKKVDARRAARKAAKEANSKDMPMSDSSNAPATSSNAEEDSDIDMVDDEETNVDATTENSIVNIKSLALNEDDEPLNKKDEDEDEPDVYDVNVTAWDTAVSPLHLAVTQGHLDVVKCLVQDFGADPLIPVKLFNDFDKSARAAILTLVLALQLPTEKAEKMARLLIVLGASSAQASLDQNTTLQYCVADTPELFETLVDADKTGVHRALNHLAVSSHWYNANVSSPMMTAIRARDSTTAIRLLAEGAKPEIDFAAYMKAYQTRFEPLRDSKQNKRNFEQQLEQPIIHSVKCELPLLAKSLVEGGANPNTLTTDGYRVAGDDHSRNYTKGTSLLDLVQEKLQKLREWEFKPDGPEAPIPLKDDAYYLSEFKEGTYALWSAEKQLNAAKRQYKQDLKDYRKRVEQSKDRTGVEEKKKAIEQKISEFETLESALLAADAKTFKDLHPDIVEPENRDRYRNWGYHPNKHEPKPFNVEIKFNIGDLTDELQEKYEELFEAAWKGDVKAVKALTLQPWKDSEAEKKAPLKIAITDDHRMSPFALAIVRGHWDMAAIAMEICQAQHSSVAHSKTVRYGVDGGEDDESMSDDDDDRDDDDVKIFSEIVDEEFTIEDIGEVSVQVKSKTTPMQMLRWSCPVGDFVPSTNDSPTSSGFSYFGPRKSKAPSPGIPNKRTKSGNIKASGGSPSGRSPKNVSLPGDLFELAVHQEDSELLKFLIDLGEKYFEPSGSEEDGDAEYSFKLPMQTFEYAIRVGNSQIAAQMMKCTGAGLPLGYLAKKYGIELHEKPRYYQGLNVRGKKRKDWVDARRLGYTNRVQGDAQSRPPLLSAAHAGSVELVEYFLTDAPMRQYKEFEKSHGEDKTIKRLAMSNAGFDGPVQRFLDTRSGLVMHLCLLGKPTAESRETLQYLIEQMPETIESKSINGYTPLMVAFDLYREDAALLIAAGADQRCRDKQGRNLVHCLLDYNFSKEKDLEKLKHMLDLLDKNVLASLFAERSRGSQTPLHYGVVYGYGDFHTEAIKIILDYGGGREAGSIGGDGNSALGYAVQTGLPDLVKVLVDYDPGLINRENAVGRTPYELAEDAALARVCNDPPPLSGDHRFTQRKAKRCGLNSHWADDVLHRPANSFAENAKTVEQSDTEEVWRMLKETKAKLDAEGNSNRRLVTLNEANLVAERLAEMKARESRRGRRRRVYGDDDEDRTKKDEVSSMITSSGPF